MESDLKRYPLFPGVVGLYSSTAQSGKSTVADVLEREYGYRRIKFASGLKTMARALLASLGYIGEELERRIDWDLKEEFIPELGVTSRFLQQTIGTEWGRQTVSESIWIDIASAQIEQSIRAGVPVVVDDVRFPNEFLRLRGRHKATLIQVSRPGYRASGEHTSESQLDNDYEFDLHFLNDQHIPQLKTQARTFLDRHWASV